MRSVKRVKMQGGLERLILLGFLSNTTFLEKVQEVVDLDAFKNKAARLIVEWCIEYYTEEACAPKRDINAIWEERCIGLDGELYTSVEYLLGELTEEMDRRNGEYNHTFALQKALKFFQTKKVGASLEEAQDLLDKGDIEQLQELLTTDIIPQYKIETTDSCNVFTDAETLQKGFEEYTTPLFSLPNVLGEFTEGAFIRNSFFTLMGMEKSGKTWWLNKIAKTAFQQKCKVLYINCGDMSNKQQALRLAIMEAGRSNRMKYCGSFYVPVLDCIWNQQNTCNKEGRKCGVGLEGVDIASPADVEQAPPSYKACRFCTGTPSFKGAVWYKKVTVENPLTWREALAINKKFITDNRLDYNDFKMYSYPATTFSIKDLDRKTEELAEKEGWLPSLVILDYMDISGGMTDFNDFRHRENEKWAAANSYAEKFDLCLGSATQTDGKAYDQDTITESNYSEDKRKYSHVSGGVFTLNQTAAELELGVMRVGRFMTRNEEKTNQQVKVLQSLRRGSIHLGSYF